MSEFKNMDTQIEEAERIGDEVASAYDRGLIERLKKANTNVVKAFNERYKAIGYQHEYGLITSEEYYKKLEQARDRYFSRDTQEWHKYTAEIYNYRKSALEDYQDYVEKNVEGLLKTIDTARDNYKGKLLDFAGSPTGFDTHKTVVENYWPNGDALVMTDYTLVDYEKEIQKLTEFNDAITKLKERATDIDAGVFSMFFDELRGMSVDDAKILTDLLLEADSEDFNKHFNLYSAKNTLAENMATSYFANDYAMAKETITDELSQAFGELPPDFFQHGQSIAQSFAEGFLSQIDALLADLTIEVPIIASGIENNNIENHTFSPVYYFYGDRATASRTRINAKNDALYSYMRGMDK